ncbi:Transcription-associated protein 1 [Pyrenophora tritici-repentis]|nr:Transcription-associated protein 1 [Pyrenophora tritici-repentis]
MRILGKLGGRNRKFITGPPELNFKPYSDDQSSIDIRLIGSTKDRAFPAAIGIDTAIAKLHEIPKTPAAKKSDTFHKQQALRLITAHTKLLVGFDSLPEDLLSSCDYRQMIYRGTGQPQEADKGVHLAVSIPELKVDAEALVSNLAKHFTLLELGTQFATVKHKTKPFDVHSGEGPVVIESDVISEAIGESLGFRARCPIFGNDSSLDKFQFFNELSSTFCHNCHADDWFMKSGGTRGIEIMIKQLGLPLSWLIPRHFELVRALNFVMKDMPIDLDSKTRIQAEGLIQDLIRRCHKKTAKEILTGALTRATTLR